MTEQRRTESETQYISVELKAAIVRYHPSGKGFGSPWTWSCVIAQNQEEASLLDATDVHRAAKRGVLELVAQKLLSLGLHYTCWRHEHKGKWWRHSLQVTARARTR